MKCSTSDPLVVVSSSHRSIEQGTKSLCGDRGCVDLRALFMFPFFFSLPSELAVTLRWHKDDAAQHSTEMAWAMDGWPWPAGPANYWEMI